MPLTSAYWPVPFPSVVQLVVMMMLPGYTTLDDTTLPASSGEARLTTISISGGLIHGHDHPGARCRGLGQPKVGQARAGIREQPAARSQHQWVEHEDELVDEASGHQRSDQHPASEHHQVLFHVLL